MAQIRTGNVESNSRAMSTEEIIRDRLSIFFLKENIHRREPDENRHFLAAVCAIVNVKLPVQLAPVEFVIDYFVRHQGF